LAQASVIPRPIVLFVLTLSLPLLPQPQLRRLSNRLASTTTSSIPVDHLLLWRLTHSLHTNKSTIAPHPLIVEMAEPRSGSASPASPSGRIAQEDLDTISEGLRLMLTNDIKGADKHWEKALADAKTRTFGPNSHYHDPSGAFTFVGALTALLHGLATLQNDQLAEAQQRLQKADELMNTAKDWPGKTVVKGLCMLLTGVVMTMQRSKTQGIWNILRSWLYLRLLESEALNYEGPERSLVRSTALLSLGVFNLVLSLLPPMLTRTASWCSGLDGSREVAMDFLRKCWKEEGLLAPFAIMCLVGYQVDVRTWLGEPMSAEPFEEANQALLWAEERFPGGLVFEGLRANYWAIKRDIPQAMEHSAAHKDLAKDLPALNLVINARRASYAQANMDWSEAAQAFRCALAVYREVNRRSFVPAMCLNAALCHNMAGEMKERDEMADLALEYKAKEDKKKWDIADKWAFELAQKCKDGTWLPEVELLHVMVLRHRSTHFMPADKVTELLNLMKKIEDGTQDVDIQCKMILFQAEVLRQSARYEEALAMAQRCQSFEGKLSPDAQKFGCLQYATYIMASSNFFMGKLGDAKDVLKKLDSMSKSHHLYHPILFKVTQLNKMLGLEMKDAYMELNVPNRDQLKYAVVIPEGTTEVEWEWMLDDFSLNFSANFTSSAAGSTPTATVVQSLEQYTATSGPCLGRYEPTKPGTLIFTFDNKFSMMRSKKVVFRVSPEHLVVAPCK